MCDRQAAEDHERRGDPERRQAVHTEGEHGQHHGDAGYRQAQTCEAVVASSERSLVGAQARAPGGVRGGYGRTMPSAIHRYKVRRWFEESVKVSTFSGVQSPNPKLCATMRVPGRSARVRIGRSVRFDAVSR